MGEREQVLTQLKRSKPVSIEVPTGPVSKVGQTTRDAIIEGAYALLLHEGVGGISTRRIAARAGVNQALVHYHFGSVDQLMVEVLNRLAIEVMGRYRDRYTGEQPFVEKYRADMNDLLTEDLHGGWGKVWLEAVALALNSPELLESFLAEQRLPARRFIEDEVLHAMGRSDRQSREDAEGISALIAMVRSGLVIDRLTGASRGHNRAIELLGEFLAERAKPITPSTAATSKPRTRAKSAPARKAKATRSTAATTSASPSKRAAGATRDAARTTKASPRAMTAADAARAVDPKKRSSSMRPAKTSSTSTR